MAGDRDPVRWCSRSSALDVWPRANKGGRSIAASQPGRIGDHGDRLGRIPRECRWSTSARRFRHFVRRCLTLVARQGALRVERATDRWCLLMLGHRQQSDAQAFFSRSGADCHAQRAGRGSGQFHARTVARSSATFGRYCRRRGHYRFPGLRGEPRLVRPRPAVSWHGTHRSIFFTGALCRCCARGRPTGRTTIHTAARCWRSYGPGPLAPLSRATRA